MAQITSLTAAFFIERLISGWAAIDRNGARHARRRQSVPMHLIVVLRTVLSGRSGFFIREGFGELVKIDSISGMIGLSFCGGSFGLQHPDQASLDLETHGPGLLEQTEHFVDGLAAFDTAVEDDVSKLVGFVRYVDIIPPGCCL